MNICISTSSFPVNQGDIAGYFVLELAKALVRQGHHVYVLCPQVQDQPYAREIDGVQIIRFRYAFRKKSQTLIGVKTGITNIRSIRQLIKIPAFLLCQGFALYRLARSRNVEAINSHWLIPQGVTAAVVARLRHIKHVPTLHSTDVFLAGKLPMKRMLCRFVDKSARQTFVVSNFVNKRYERILGHASGARILPMGIDTSRFRKHREKSGTGKTSILFVGRLLPIKGVYYLIEAIALLAEKGMDITLTIIGDGEERQNLERQARQLNLENQVEFRGKVDNTDLPEHYNKADIVAVPSVMLPSGETEGMPVVILEAMACGTPIVASDVGGASDIVMDGHNGYLVEPANAAQLAEGLSKAIQNHERLSQDAYRTGQNFSWERIAQEYIDALCR